MSDLNLDSPPNPASPLGCAAAIGGLKALLVELYRDMPDLPDPQNIWRRTLVERAIRITNNADAYYLTVKDAMGHNFPPQKDRYQ